jgi:hypothetical protein
VDYHRLNAVTKPDKFPIPRVNSLLDNFRDSNWFSGINLASGYWQVEMSKEDRKKTAFIIEGGLYEFNVMPFGLRNAPGTFQRLMNHILRDFLGKFVAVYLDDIIIYSNTFEQHLDHIQQVFEALRKANLKIKLKKCFFCYPEIEFFGHIVGRNGLKSDPKKIEKVQNLPNPTNITELQSLLGLFSYYRKFIKDFSKHAAPMLKLLKKEEPFVWGEKQKCAFEFLKECLINAPILQYPNFQQPFILLTDASGVGIGAVLAQIDEDGNERAVAYASRSLTPAERNYGITDLECLAVVWAVQYFEHYLQLLPFKIVTDHAALKYLKTLKKLKGRRARWTMELQQYNFEIIHRPGKENKNADALSRVMINYNGIEYDNNNNKGKHREDCECQSCTFNNLDDGQIMLQILDHLDANYPNEEWITMEEMVCHTVQGMECSTPQIMCAFLNEARRIYEDGSWNNVKYFTLDSRFTQKVVSFIKDFRDGTFEVNNYEENDEESDNESYISMESLNDEKQKLENLQQNPIRLISPRPWECCGEIICRCYDVDEISAPPSSINSNENDNGWGPEYYHQTTWSDYSEDESNDNWSHSDNKDEQEIDELWSIETPAWTYTNKELNQYYKELTKERWVVANQPQKRGRMKCINCCDTENHHLHQWCKPCEKRIEWENNHIPTCKFGIEQGQIKPEMNPEHLVNEVFWNEPTDVL